LIHKKFSKSLISFEENLHILEIKQFFQVLMGIHLLNKELNIGLRRIYSTTVIKHVQCIIIIEQYLKKQ
jgi:hypothetical protein